MVRSYLRHEPTQAFGLICSQTSRCALASDGKTATVAALEDVLRWDVKTGQMVSMWHEIGHRSPVTALAHNASSSPESNNAASSSRNTTSYAGDDLWAVGYADGSIRVWDAYTATIRLTLNGHKSAITCLQFSSDGLVLASGSQDTNVTLWDIVAEAGIFRLRGHRDAITDLSFLQIPTDGESEQDQAPVGSERLKQYLVSSSKDGLLKVWDLALQHCVETVLPGKGELWSLAVLTCKDVSVGTSEAQALVLCGNSEGQVRLYETSKSALHTQAHADDEFHGSSSKARFLRDVGQIQLSGARRVTQIQTWTSGNQQARFIAVSGSDRSVEIFRLRTEDDIKRKMARRKRRLKEKAAKQHAEKEEQANDDNEAEDVPELTWSDRVEAYTIVRPTKGRLRSFTFAEATVQQGTAGHVSLMLALNSNALEVHQVPLPKTIKGQNRDAASLEAVLAFSLELAGHRAEARALALNSDDTLLASADSAGTLKIWNVSTAKMVRTLSCGYALSLTWLPDDQHILVGCKDGSLKTYDIRAGVQIEDIKAHEGPIWSVIVHPGGRSCLTASGDKDVKFWDFEARIADEKDEAGEDENDDGDDDESNDDEPRPPRGITTLGLVHVRTLKMTDDILCARYSPDGRLLALALLDSTVKIFFTDTLKFFLSLYGHKLPVLALDISDDSKLCVTVSADKNAKIWGLDYGDCHRSLFAHDESILGVAFEKGSQGGGLLGGREGTSHHFWTCGKDGKLKYWDGDRFQCIQTMLGHHGDVTGLAVGHRGSLIVSAGLDRSLRVWEKSDEPLFLEEERERELEEMYEGGGDQRERDDDERQYGSLAEGKEDGQTQAELNGKEAEAVSLSTRETMMAGERLLEAIELAAADVEATADYEKQKQTTGLDLAPPARNPLLTHSFQPGEEVDPQAYVLRVTAKIPSAQLEDALLVLPFDATMRLLGHLDHWASKEWNVSLTARILFFLLRNYHAQIVSHRIMRTTLQSLRGHLRASLQRQKMTIGYNLAGLQFVKTRLEEKRTGELYMQDGFDIDENAIKQRLNENKASKRKMIA